MNCSFRRNFVSWSALVSCGLMLVAASAHAEVCIPQAGGVPALGGPPNWDDDANDDDVPNDCSPDAGMPDPALCFPQVWPRLDDPRWRGAHAISFGSGAVEQVSFRLLKAGTGASAALYLSWDIKADALLEPSFDHIALAISPGGAAQDVLMEIVPFGGLAADMTAEFPYSTQTRLRPAAGAAFGAAQPAEPDWLKAGTTHVWLDVANQTWAVNVKLPIAAAYDAGINLASSFKLWFEVPVSQPGGTVVPYRNSALDFTAIETGTSSAGWPQFNRSIAPGGAGCDKGVSLAVANVGTKFVDGGGVARPNRIDITGPNTFFARPTNETGANVPANRITATFRIANWGTQPDWNDVADPANALWKQIGGSATNAGVIANGTTASEAASNEITLPWTLTNAERCEFDPALGAGCPNAAPTRRPHQCMLVELSGGGYTYTPASVYRNMDFVDASKFERAAEISVAGLKPLSGAAQRDVYLLVRPYQMPRDVAKAPPQDSLRDFGALHAFLSKAILEQPHSATHAVAPRLGQPRFGDLEALLNLKFERGKLAGRPPLGLSTEILKQIYPTYIVHAYHDTGETMTWRGVTRKVLKPQSSFGYHIHHEGGLQGWKHMLAGAVEIAPNFYKLGVPEKGSVKVSTNIATCDDKPCEPETEPDAPDGGAPGGNAGATAGGPGGTPGGVPGGSPPCTNGCCGCRSNGPSSAAAPLLLIALGRQRRRRRARADREDGQ